MLIISAFRSADTEKSQSATRVIWMIPSIFAAFMLASAGADIYLDGETTTLEYEVLNSTNSIIVLNSTETVVNKITLLQPVWVTFHIMFFLVMLIFVIINILNAFTKR